MGVSRADGLAPALRRGERLPALDGVRGSAVILVMLFHFKSKPLVPGGFLAVDLFFVLSGFLITGLLLSERRTRGTIGLKAFYLRRAARLLPAYLLVWLAYLLAVLLLPAGITSVASLTECLPDLALGLGYVFNWKLALSASSPPSIAHLWSLCIEEQYYLLWPCVVMLVAGYCKSERQALLVYLGLACVACLVPGALHQLYALGWRRLYYGTDARLHGLLVGSVLGSARACRLPVFEWMGRPLARQLLAAAAIWFVADLMTVEPVDPVFLTGELPALSVGLALLVSAASELRAGAVYRVLASPALVYLGRRSYALYLWHLPLAHWFRRLEPVPHVLLCFAASLLMAELSWQLLERHALRYGSAVLRRREQGRVAGHQLRG